MVISEEPQIYEICRTFKTAEKPNYYVLWPYSKSKGWCDKIEVKIN
jgi:hypothetical protein